jgi:hypothetical protein
MHQRACLAKKSTRRRTIRYSRVCGQVLHAVSAPKRAAVRTEPVRVAGNLRSPRRNEVEECGAERFCAEAFPRWVRASAGGEAIEEGGEEGEDKVEKKRTYLVGGWCMDAPEYVLAALLRRALARYTSISARASETRSHDGAPPSTPG